MLLIFPKEPNMKKLGRRSIGVYRRPDQKKTTKNLSKEWVIDSKYLKKVTDRAILEPKPKFDHCSVD